MSHVAPASTALLHEDHREMLAAFRARDTAALVAASHVHHRRLQTIAESLTG